MGRFFNKITVSLGCLALGALGCGPFYSAACDQVAVLCSNIDLSACYAEMEIAPPRIRSELVDCAYQASICDEAVDCFTSRGYYLPTLN